MLFNANKQLIDQKDISQLAKTCGDGACADYENYTSCKEDCPPSGKDGFCNQSEAVNDPDCIKTINNVDVTKNNTSNNLLSKNIIAILIIILIIIFCILLILLFKNKKRNNSEEENL